MRVVYLAAAEQDLRELRRYVTQNFGKPVWLETRQKIRDSLQIIRALPLSGTIPDELAELGQRQYRQAISGMSRLIYRTGADVIYIPIICDSRRDLCTLLTRRLTRAPD